MADTNVYEVCDGYVDIHDLKEWCKIKFEKSDENPLKAKQHLYLNGKEVTDLVLPDDVTEIGRCAFFGCTYLESVTIPASLKSISRSAFNGCSSLKKVNIAEGVETIEDCAFLGCTALETIDLPKSLKVLKSAAFSGCSALKSIVIPEGVKKIEDQTFLFCKNLKEVTIPESMEEIYKNGDYTDPFAGSGMWKVFFNGTKSEWKKFENLIGSRRNISVICKDGDYETESEEEKEANLKKSLEMVEVEGGTATLVNDEVGKDTPHEAKIESFKMMKYPVTQDLFQNVMGWNKSLAFGFMHPVECVTWYEAIDFCNALSEKEGLEPYYEIGEKKIKRNTEANGYRLPTKDEWEYAARGGQKSEGFKYSGSNNVDEVAWYKNCHSTMEVGLKKPNELGLYDMTGNVREMCWEKKDGRIYDLGGYFSNLGSPCIPATNSSLDDRKNGKNGTTGFRVIRK